MSKQARELKVLHKTNPLTKSTGTSIPTIITTSRSTTTPITSTTTAFTLFLGNLTQTNSTTTITTVATTITTTNTTTAPTAKSYYTNSITTTGAPNLAYLFCVKKFVRACGKKNTLNKKIQVKNLSVCCAQVFLYG